MNDSAKRLLHARHADLVRADVRSRVALICTPIAKEKIDAECPLHWAGRRRLQSKEAVCINTLFSCNSYKMRMKIHSKINLIEFL